MSERHEMNVDSGEIWTTEELKRYYESHTTEEIKEFESRFVRVAGSKEAIATLSANVAVSKANLDRLHKEAEERARRKLR